MDGWVGGCGGGTGLIFFTWGFTHDNRFLSDCCFLCCYYKPLFSEKQTEEKKPNDFVAAMKRKGEKVNLQQTAFVPSDSHALWGGRPARTHYDPLASAKAVTLTNSQCHNSTLAQFVFSFNPFYSSDTKAARPDLSNVPQQQTCTKRHFWAFWRKRKGQSCCFIFFNPPPNHTDTFKVFLAGGVVGR